MFRIGICFLEFGACFSVLVIYNLNDKYWFVPYIS